MLSRPLRLLASLTPTGLPVAGDVVRAGIGRVFGPPPFDPAADPGDPGLFGPGSASWRVIAEPASIVGGIRALCVQALHPHAMAGVADHSGFRQDPLGRLHRTSAYVTATTYGSTREALAAACRVRGVHDAVVGVAPDGRPYRASDPRLLAWVSIALTSSFLAADRAYAPRPVDRQAADAFVSEQSRAAALLDPRVDLDALAGDPGALAALRAGRLPLPMLEEGALPQDAAALEETLAAYRPELAVNEQGREAVRFLLWPDLELPVKAAYLPLIAGAVATLDPAQRELLGLPSSGLAAAPFEAQARLLLGLTRLASGVSPAVRAATRRAAAAVPVAAP